MRRALPRARLPPCECSPRSAAPCAPPGGTPSTDCVQSAGRLQGWLPACWPVLWRPAGSYRRHGRLKQAAEAVAVKAESVTKNAAATKAVAAATVAAKVATAAKAAAAKVPSKAVITKKPAASTKKNSATATVTGLKPGQKVKVTVNVKPKP